MLSQLLVALALVFGTPQKEEVTQDFKPLITGTGVTFHEYQGESGGKNVELITEGPIFTSGWDPDVVKRAHNWANQAQPNAHIVIEKISGKWRIIDIHSAADPWGRGGTAMEEVADDYLGRKVTMKVINRFLADMKTAYHEQFAKE